MIVLVAIWSILVSIDILMIMMIMMVFTIGRYPLFERIIEISTSVLCLIGVIIVIVASASLIIASV